MKNICTLFGLGNISKMPGTLGSIVGVLVGVFLLYLLPIQLFFIIFIFLLFISFYAIKKYQSEVDNYNTTCFH